MKLKFIILSVFITMSSVSLVFAGEGHDHHDHGKKIIKQNKGSNMDHKGSMIEKSNSESMNVGNKICPVSKQAIGGSMGAGVPVEYNGKIYNLCCGMCTKNFKQNPDKFIKIINEELNGLAQ